MKKLKGLRRRWILNTVGVVGILGIVCVLAITALFAGSYYSNMESDMYNRAESTTVFFEDYLSLEYNRYYQSCITYAKTFEQRNSMELQFIDAEGKLVVSSFGDWAGHTPVTPEIRQAQESRSIRSFVGNDPYTGERIMAVSSPMIYSNGEVIGVLRYVTSTRLMDQQILRVAMVTFLGFLAVIAVVMISSGYYIRSILHPVKEITDKAKRIAGGT